VLDTGIPTLPIAVSEDSGREAPQRRLPAVVGRHPWLGVGLLVAAVSITFVAWSGMRPGYDAYGWLVWGRQTLHWDLDTNGAPSWKPLTFLFTLPYALSGGLAVWLWMVTAVAAGLSGSVFAARIAFRLSGAAPERRYAAWGAAAFAGLGILGLNGYWQLVLQANSDPMIISLCLAAIDLQLSGRPRIAFAALVLAALGRPEVWAFVALFVLWAWWRRPSMRLPGLIGLAIIPLLWFGVPALTSHSLLTPGDLALNSIKALHGSKITGVLGRFLDLNEVPVRLAALLAVVVAVARRDRDALLLAGAACLWVAIEIGFALHGWSAVSRYMAAPAAVVVVLAGVAVGQLLSAAPSWSLPHATVLVSWAVPAAVLVLVGSLVPAAGTRAMAVHAQIRQVRTNTIKIKRLQAVIERDGGGARIRACGQPVATVGYQSILAWDLGMNVGNVGYKPGRSINQGHPIVLFKRHQLVWTVRPIHTRAAQRAKCLRLRF
jgi:hypothetical protein